MLKISPFGFARAVEVQTKGGFVMGNRRCYIVRRVRYTVYLIPNVLQNHLPSVHDSCISQRT